MTSDAAIATPVWRNALRALGNVFLGMALGLIGYSAVTGLVGLAGQRSLKSDAADVASFRTADPSSLAAADADAVFEWGGWESEDEAYWKSLPEGGAFGRLVISPLDLDSLVVKGATRAALKRGPGWIDYTDLPGPTGNAGISGHRTTYLAPFRNLDRLKPGDTIEFYSPFRRYEYEVFEQLTVTPDRVDVVESTEEPQLTLTACHPPYSARYRLVIHARLVDVRRLGASPSNP